jgi:hypothetical protein
VESSCKQGNEPLVSIKCWELSNGCTTCGFSSGTQLHRVSWLVFTKETILIIFSMFSNSRLLSFAYPFYILELKKWFQLQVEAFCHFSNEGL